MKNKNNMKKKIALIALTIVIGNFVYGQKAENFDYKQGKSFSLQMDAFDFMAKGFSLWGNYTFNYNRIFLDGGINQLPDFLNSLSDDFTEKRKYFIQAGYYRFIKKPNELFIGVELIYQQMKISNKSTSEVMENGVLRIAPVLGFEWIPFKSYDKFSITPWVSERLPLYSKEVYFPLAAKNYKTADFNFVMGCNIGIRLGKN